MLPRAICPPKPPGISISPPWQSAVRRPGSPARRARRFFTPPTPATRGSRFSTGVSIPLTAISFVDDAHGWAVGALGTILATSDGGQTWRRQRSGGARAALLCLVAEADDVPLELLAKISGNDGYLSAAEVLCRRDVEVRPKRRSAPGRTAASGRCRRRRLLCPSGLAVSLASTRRANCRTSIILPPWDAIHNGRGMEELEEHIVRQLRLWRPEVVFTNDVNSRDADQLAQLVGKAVLQAVGKAADPACYPEQIAEAGLTPWQVKKVYAAADSGAGRARWI